jgi:SAM-dependent methyltransferase
MNAANTSTIRDDHAVANREQHRAWNGPEGAHWARESERSAEGADLAEPLLGAAALTDGEHVLDVGCGIGQMTRDAARRTPSGWATGIDLSALMVEQARARAAAEGLANISFEHADAQVHPFVPGGFDAVVSHFGAMFFDDPVAGFTNLAAALRRGGRLALVCPQAMDRCAWYVEPLAALLGRRPTADDAPSRMFSLAEPDDVEDLLHRVGFGPVRLEPLDADLWFGADAATGAAFYLGSGPVRSVLERTPDLSPARAAERLEQALAPFVTSDGVRIPGAHWLVTAVRR